MSVASPTARELLDRCGEHPVLSVVFDLDPERFATAPARATQARSLLDAAHNLIAADETLSHDARQTLNADLTRLEEHLASDDLPVSGAGALLIYACGAAGVWETVPLSAPAESAVAVERAPRIEPLVTRPPAGRWCAVLTTGRETEIVIGDGQAVSVRQQSADYVRSHGHADGQMGHAEEQDAEGHILQVARGLHEDHRAFPFTTLFVGGPTKPRAGLIDALHAELRELLADEPLEVDISAVSESELRDAVLARLRAAQDRRRDALRAELTERLAMAAGREEPARAVRDVDDVLAALAEQRVETVLMAVDFHAAGTRCAQCGLLYGYAVDSCPVDGTTTAPVADLREPIMAAAVRQDAQVVVLPDPVEELPAAHPVAALLRF